MGSMSLSRLTDREVMAELGARLGALRRRRGFSVVAAAEGAGLSRRTVHRAELGDNPTLLTLVRLLRLYGEIDGLAAFLRAPEVSPMALLEAERKRGRRG